MRVTGLLSPVHLILVAGHHHNPPSCFVLSKQLPLINHCTTNPKLAKQLPITFMIIDDLLVKLITSVVMYKYN